MATDWSHGGFLVNPDPESDSNKADTNGDGILSQAEWEAYAGAGVDFDPDADYEGITVSGEDPNHDSGMPWSRRDYEGEMIYNVLNDEEYRAASDDASPLDVLPYVGAVAGGIVGGPAGATAGYAAGDWVSSEASDYEESQKEDYSSGGQNSDSAAYGNPGAGNVPVYEELGDQARAGVYADAASIRAQEEALAQMQTMGRGELLPGELQAQRLQQQEAAQFARAQQQAALQQLYSEGMGGSGVDTAARLGAQQAGANRLNTAWLESQKAAMERALNANVGAGNLAGDMRGQGFDEEGYRASAIDEAGAQNLAIRNSAEDARVSAAQQNFMNNLAASQGDLDIARFGEEQRQYNEERSDARWDKGVEGFAGIVDYGTRDDGSSGGSPSQQESAYSGGYNTDEDAEFFEDDGDDEEDGDGLGRPY